MKIALIQQSASDNIPANLKKGLFSAKEAALNGANNICFAELVLTKFYPQNPSDNNNVELAETIPDKVTKLFSKLAKEFGVVIILNLFDKDGEKTYDSSLIINLDGNILGITRMVHITDYTCFHEKGYYDPATLVLLFMIQNLEKLALPFVTTNITLNICVRLHLKVQQLFLFRKQE